jgi:2-iminobutanoate/2-iminopropanoate deaminase
MPMAHETPDQGSPTLPPTGGHYRHVVRRGNLIVTAGQVGWDEQHRFPEGIAAQTRQALENLRVVLRSEGAGFGDLLSITAYLADLDDFAAYNDAYREVIPVDPPARTSIGARLPAGCLIEISGIAALD